MKYKAYSIAKINLKLYLSNNLELSNLIKCKTRDYLKQEGNNFERKWCNSK